jgi:hypothetical protein
MGYMPPIEGTAMPQLLSATKPKMSLRDKAVLAFRAVTAVIIFAGLFTLALTAINVLGGIAKFFIDYTDRWM